MSVAFESLIYRDAKGEPLFVFSDYKYVEPGVHAYSEAILMRPVFLTKISKGQMYQKFLHAGAGIHELSICPGLNLVNFDINDLNKEDMGWRINYDAFSVVRFNA